MFMYDYIGHDNVLGCIVLLSAAAWREPKGFLTELCDWLEARTHRFVGAEDAQVLLYLVRHERREAVFGLRSNHKPQSPSQEWTPTSNYIMTS